MSTGSYPRARFAVSPLVAGVATSKTVAIFSQTSEMKSRGEAVNAALCVGQPDFPPPPAVVEATAEAAAKGLTTYTALLGTLELRRAICEYLVRAKGTPYAEDEVMVSGGGKQAIYEAMVALCQPGDEVVIPAPYYTSYPDIVGLAGATSVIMPTHPSDDYVPTVAELERALNERTRILILCNPCNPTGAVIPRERLEQIAQLLRRPDLAHILVLSDEIYEAITYGVPHVSFAALDGMKERTLTINGFSKAYSMTGYRLGVPTRACARTRARSVRATAGPPTLQPADRARALGMPYAPCAAAWRRLPRGAGADHQSRVEAAGADLLVRQLHLAARGRRRAHAHARRFDRRARGRAVRQARPCARAAPADPKRVVPDARGCLLPAPGHLRLLWAQDGRGRTDRLGRGGVHPPAARVQGCARAGRGVWRARDGPTLVRGHARRNS